MAMAEDAYAKWLKIPSGPRPPRSHVLLGIAEDESDAKAIDQAANRRMDELDRYALSGDRACRSQIQQLMNEIAQARIKLIQRAKAATPPRVVRLAEPIPADSPAPVQAEPVAIKPTPVTRALRVRKPTKLDPNLFWSGLIAVWTASIVVVAWVTYAIVQADPPGPMEANRFVSTPGQEDAADALSSGRMKEPADEAGADSKANTQADGGDDPVTQPGPPEIVAPAQLLTWDEIKQIQDRDKRLQAYLNLRDSYEDFDQKFELIRLAMLEFNGVDSLPLSNNSSKATGLRAISLRPSRKAREGAHPNLQVTDITPFTGLKLAALQIEYCENLINFEPLRTIEVETLYLVGCKQFADVSVLNGTKVRGQLRLDQTGVKDLSPLELEKVGFFILSGGEALKSLDGLQGIEIGYLALGGMKSLEDIWALREVTGLKGLEIDGAPITDLLPIAELSLERLALINCENLTSLRGLESMKMLRSLRIRDLPNLPAAEAKRLKENNPDLWLLD